MNRTNFTFDKLIHNSRLRVFSRRAVSLVLALTMCAGFLPAAHATNVAPTKQHINVNTAGDPDGTGEAPTVTVEANAVVDGDGLTGFLEVALRVRPGVLYYDDADPDNPVLLSGKDAADTLEAGGGTVRKEIQPFNTLAVALRYSSRLTPWEWVDEDPNWDNPSAETAVAVVPTGSTLAGKDMVPMSHAGSAYLNTVDARVSDYKDDTFGGYLYFEVKNNTPRELDPEEDWVLGVVRFQYEVDPDDSGNNPLATNTDSAKWVTPSDPNCLLQFVDPADIFDVDYTTLPLWECYYDGENNDFYYTAERDTTTGKPSYGMEAPDPALGGADPNSTMNNMMEVNVVDPASGDDITLGKINFTLVNHITYNIAARGMTTLLFYDWDDELLGAQAVLPNRDVQEQVNNYVKEKLIHPDIAAKFDADIAAGSDTTCKSLARTDNYRGRYPFSGPTGPDSEKRTNGDEYPLTYKLDYTFFKRNMTLDETDPDNPIWKQDTTNAWNADYPLTEGWALCSRRTIRDTWTTLGAGELSDYAVTAGMDDASFTVADGMAFDFADFAAGFGGSETYIKAVYEPGDGLIFGDYNSDPAAVKYLRYGYSDSTLAGGAFGIQFKYERVHNTGWGVTRTRNPAVRLSYTVDEQSEAGTSFFMRMDVDNVDLMDVEFIPSGTLLSLEYALVDQYNADFVTGTDRSTYGNLQDLPYDFDYEEFNHPNRQGTPGFVLRATLRQILVQAAKAYSPKGTAADVTKLNSMLSLGTIKDLNFRFGSQELGSMIVDFDATYLPMGRDKLKNLFQATYAAGLIKTFTDPADGKDKEELDLDWHQIQYHILTSDLTGNGGAISGSTVMTSAQCIAAYGNFSWCRLHGAAGNCTIGFVSGGGSKPINSWDDLRKALAEYVYIPNGSALNQLNQTFDLRKGITAEPFADVNALKTALTTLVTDLKDNHSFARTDVEGLSWKQVQYLLDLVNDGTGLAGVTPGTLPADSDITPTGSTGKDYWWEDGGSAPTISSWQELLEIQYHIYKNGYFAGNATTSGWRSNYDVSTAPALNGEVRDKDSSGAWKPTTDPSPFTTISVALRQDGDGTKFPTTDNGSTLVAALNRAIDTLNATYPGGSYSNISLMEIQHAMIKDNPYKSEADLMDDTVAGTINYWWITGAPTINDLHELVTWVKKVVDGAPSDLLEDVTVAKMSKGPFWLRASTAGGVHADDTTLRDDLILAVDDWCAAGNDPDTAPWPAATNTNWSNDATRQVWSQLQNLLLGNIYEPDPDPGATATPPKDYKYWWYADGSKPIDDLASLLEAAWNSYGTPSGSAPSGSTDPNAIDALTEANIGFITGTPVNPPQVPPIDPTDYVYFRKNTDGDPFDSVANFKAALKTAMQKITAVNPALSFTTGLDWIQVQYLLMSPTNNYRPATNAFGTGLRQDSDINYWWENGGSKPEESSVSYDEADALIAEYMGKATTAWDLNLGDITTGDVSISIPADVVTKLNLQDGSGNVLTETQIIQYIVEAANEFGQDVWGDDPTNTTEWSTYLNYPNLELDWKSFQYWILHRSETDIADKQLALKNKPYSQISTAPYNIPWTPEQPAPANYTKGDAMIAGYMSEATTAWDLNLGDITTSDVTFSISAADAAALNLQDGGGNVLNAAQITAYIVEAANEFGQDVWGDSPTNTTEWSTYLNYPNLELDWKSFQYWILHKDETNIANKQKALKNKTEAEISAAPYNITWAPEAPTPVDYTWADGKIAAYMGDATTAWDLNLDDITTGDVTFSISAAEAAALNLQDAGGSVLNETQLTAYIVEAANEFGQDVWGDSPTNTTEWSSYLEYPDLKLDWKSFQYWLLHKDETNIANKQKALKDKTEEEIGGAPYNITWAPADAQPTSLSRSTAKKTVKKALQPVTTEETTNTVTTADELRKVTTTTKTTTDPNTGITEIREEVKTELTVGDQLVTTVDVTTITINTKTGEYTKKTTTGTPAFTDLAAVVMPGTGETEKGEGTENKGETTDPNGSQTTTDDTKDNVGADDPVGPQEPADEENKDNTNDPDAKDSSSGTGDVGDASGGSGAPPLQDTTDPTKDDVGADDPVGPQTPTDPDNPENGDGAAGSSTGTTDDTKDDVGADDPVGPQTTTDPDNKDSVPGASRPTGTTTDQTDDDSGGSVDPPPEPGGMATARTLRKLPLLRRFAGTKLRYGGRSPGEILGPHRGFLTATEPFNGRNTSSGRTLS